MESDDWLKQLVANEPTSEVPQADVADKVLRKLHSLEVQQSRDWLSPVLVACASLATSWLVWIAMPAWQRLAMPLTTITDQLSFALTASH